MWINFLIIIIGPLCCLTTSSINVHANIDDIELWESTRRELVRRTREYIKKNPISKELQEFIDELSKPQRKKRQDEYVVKNGDIMPLKDLEKQLNTDPMLLDAQFTVLPLIIPMESDVTLKEYSTNNIEMHHQRDVESAPSSGGEPGDWRKSKNKDQTHSKVSDDAADTNNNNKEETVIDNLIEDKIKSSTELNSIGKILEDVENLIVASKSGKGHKEGVLCNVSGYWDSDVGGMTFHIRKKDSKTNIEMKPLEPPSEDGFLCADKWNISAIIPFRQAAQVIITLSAQKGRKVAVFHGECRVCEGSETITGDWLIGRSSSDCKGEKASHSFTSDIFRKNNVQTLRDAHMKKLTACLPDATTTMEA